MNNKFCYPEFGGRNGWGPNDQFGMFLVCCVYPVSWFKDIVGACCDHVYFYSMGFCYVWVGLAGWYNISYGGLNSMAVYYVADKQYQDLGASL